MGYDSRLRERMVIMRKEQFVAPTLEIFTFDAQDNILTTSSTGPNTQYIVQYNDYAANALQDALGVDSIVREQ